MIDEDRGTGRTTRQLREAPDVFVYVVHHRDMVRQTEDLMRKHEIAKTVRFCLHDQIPHRIQGMSIPVIVDHATLEYLRPEQVAHISQHNSRYWPD